MKLEISGLDIGISAMKGVKEDIESSDARSEEFKKGALWAFDAMTQTFEKLKELNVNLKYDLKEK